MEQERFPANWPGSMGGVTGSDTGAMIIYLTACLRLGDDAARRDAARKPDIAAYGRTAPDGDTPENGGASVNDYLTLHDAIAHVAFYQLAIIIQRNTLRAQGDRPV